MSLHVDLAAFYKHTNYEQANRVPLIIVAPSITKPASVTRQLAESADVFPTLAELAGLPIPTGPQPIDGKSLVPVLRDPAVRVRDHAYHVFPKGKLGRAIRTELCHGRPRPLQIHSCEPEHAARMKQLRAAAVAELRRTGAKLVDSLPPVGE